MARNFINIVSGLNITSQIPLNKKEYIINELTLSNLGASDNLAFTYYDGLKVYCFEEKTTWIWREVQDGEELTGLIPTDFTYPSDWIVEDCDYSNKTYNFFPDLGTQGPPGEDGLAATITLGTVSTGVAGSNVIITNSGSSSAATFNFTIPRGDQGIQGEQGDPGQDLTSNLQKTITGSYVISNVDNNYTIFINNAATPINITIPSGLMSAIDVGFIQQGSGDVTFVQSGTVINSPSSMKKIKGQNYQGFITQVGSTNVYHLLGNLKA